MENYHLRYISGCIEKWEVDARVFQFRGHGTRKLKRSERQLSTFRGIVGIQYDTGIHRVPCIFLVLSRDAKMQNDTLWNLEKYLF